LKVESQIGSQNPDWECKKRETAEAQRRRENKSSKLYSASLRLCGKKRLLERKEMNTRIFLPAGRQGSTIFEI